MIKKIKFNIKAIILFVLAIAITYTMIYFITPGDFFKSPMYMLLPIIGFLGMFFITTYVMDYMHLKNKYYFMLIFLAIGIVGYYLAIFFFYWNIIRLNELPMKELFKFVFTNYKLFLTSAFLEFLVAGSIGILATEKK